MAERLDFKPPLLDPREVLLRKLAVAPAEHAAALLDAYEILQLLREKGVLEIAKGTLGSGELLLGAATETLESDAVVTLLRNLVLLTKILGGLNPVMLEEIQSTLLASAEWPQKPPGILRTLRRFFSADCRAALQAIAAVLGVTGRHLRRRTAAQDFRRAHEPVRRHEA